MSSVVVTGTGIVTPAGLGATALRDALRRGDGFVRSHDDEPWPSGRVPRQLVIWPEQPQWQAVREYAGRGSELAVTAATLALDGARARSPEVDLERAATIAVARDDWSDQPTLDDALCRAESGRTESRALFERLEEAFLLRTFRWGVAYGIAALSGFSGPSVGIDSPSFGGLSGLVHAVDLIQSGEVDIVLLAGVDTRWRNDTAFTLHRLGSAGLSLGEGAAALVLERESTARRRGAAILARIAGCSTTAAPDIDAALSAVGSKLPAERCDLGWAWSSGDPVQEHAESLFWSARSAPELVTTTAAIGTLLTSGALIHACLASDWLAGAAMPQGPLTRPAFSRSTTESTAEAMGSPETGTTDVVAVDRFWAVGAGICRLVSSGVHG